MGVESDRPEVTEGLRGQAIDGVILATLVQCPQRKNIFVAADDSAVSWPVNDDSYDGAQLTTRKSCR